MTRSSVLLPLAILALASTAAGAQVRGAAGIEQVPTPRRAVEQIGVAPVGANRSSATEQSATAEAVPPAVSAETLAACRRARAQDRPAPKGVDCIRALQVATPARPAAPAAAAPTAEVSLLGMLGQNAEMLGGGGDPVAPASADDVARQLSAGEIQGDAAASIARDRPAPQAPPPR